jgi:hypothetical protein
VDNKKYLVFWKCIANAGIYDYDDLETAERVAQDLFKTKHVIEVEILIVEGRRVVKTKKDWEKQGRVSGLEKMEM